MGLEYTLNDNEKLKLRIGEERAKELGLKSERVIADCEPRNPNDYWLTYKAYDIHRLLGDGVERYGFSCADGYYLKKQDADTQCLCIGIRPIVKESPERELLRRIIERDKRERFIYDEQWEIAVQKLLEG